ncbi:hypothetical protein AAGT10_14770 (plasmid) [Sulfolobus tengchongensis]|uniref:Uncharacterized protein n=1 Tax=Sulfolobus tengchongensis TaxID=207809 RepID=A0AAX4L0R8_9CREN
MAETIEFPDTVELIRNDQMPENLYAPDGTLLISDNDYMAETPLIKNRKKWRLYPNVELYSFDGETAVYRRLSDGVLVRMTDVYAINMVGIVRRNPGITVEEAIATELKQIEDNEGEITDEKEMAATLSVLYYALALTIIHDLVRLQK